ncbi:hypothetical protein OS493_003978 [Desmophyllum pertusum]|uniref:Uncharacterized protein n=1 Tax=Desmophyllum pertusum TaxID=174260 RepID=A0A9X0D4X5_9CNID|nr:hypothetical protein OS493_003978 [Desmophyllum pertusum]
MNSGQEGVIAVREERTREGGVEVARKTLIATTNEGVVTVQVNTVETRNPTTVVPLVRLHPHVITIKRKKSWSNCLEDFCCLYDVDSEWYEFKGKGCWYVLFLLLCYLIFGILLLVGGILYCICKCIEAGCNQN